MNLIKEDGIWIWEGDFQSRHIPKAAGFYFNHKSDPKNGIPVNVWYTNSIENASKLIEYASGEVKNELNNHLGIKDENLEASVATDADINIPAPDGMDYFGYQKAGIQFAARNKNALIADEMGLGKTIQAIGLINFVRDINKVLIVCPASLKINWKRELQAWLTRNLSISVLGTSDTEMDDSDIHIINYDIIAKKKMSWINKVDYDLIVADEAHYVKNKKAQRSKAFYKLAKEADYKVLLTGTPILNRPVELHPLIECLGSDLSFWYYVHRYCQATETDFGWDFSGAERLDELQLKLRETVMVRRLKSEVLHQLPAKRRQIIELDATNYGFYLSREREFLDRNVPNDYLTKGDDANDSYESKVGLLKEMPVDHVAEMAKLRHELALQKVPDVVEHISSVLEEQDKVVVFAHHRDVINGIYGEFEDIAVKLMGGMSDEEKDEAVNAFQNGEKRLFIGSIKAAGVGLTLTAASVVIFAELDWVPANLSQAEDRCHRIGQSDSVLVQHIVVDGSIDSNLAKRVIYKQNIIDKALNADNTEALKAVKQRELENAKHKMKKELETAKKKAVEAKKKAVEAKKKKAKRRKEEKAAGIKQYTKEEVQAILKKLRYLAGVCDYANSEDGMGFNKLDASFGHDLARKNWLTNKQAAAAEKMLKKYHGQFA